VVLVDMDFADPRLHEAAGTPNDEGLGDIALFGASLAGVAHRVPDRAIDFVPAGAYVPDVDEAFAAIPWHRLLAEAAEAGGIALFYMPADRFTAEVSEILPNAVFLGGTKDAWEADRDWPPAGVVALAIAPPVPPLDEAESVVPAAPADEPAPVEAPVAEVAEVAEGAAVSPDSGAWPSGACVSRSVILELQSAFAGAVGDGLHATMVAIPAAIEHNLRDALGLGPLGEQLSRGLGLGSRREQDFLGIR
jgi:hypothetical protein